MSKVLNFFASTFDAFPPICIIPNAVINLYKSFCLLFSIAFIKFVANFVPFFFNVATSSNVKLYISATFEISFLSISWSIIFSPKPSIFIASRDTKCTKFLYSFAGHSVPVHLTADSPSSLTVFAPHTGHISGILNSFSVPSLSSFITFTISGITSPAF